MDFSKEIWHCELYKLQQQAPNPIVVKSKRKLENRPPQLGAEYHGNIDRNETEKLLLDYENGAFLIRDSQRNVGTYTLVIRFDRVNKNYVLYYKPETRQHYVGSKYFDNIIELVQDGLIHMYIESRGAHILLQISEPKDYESTQFFRSKLYTLRQNVLEKKNVMSDRLSTSIGNYNNSCDSENFNTPKSNESSLDKGDSGSDHSSNKITQVEVIPVVNARSKSMYVSLPTKSKSRHLKSTKAHYELIFGRQVSMTDIICDETDSPTPSSKLSNNQTNRIFSRNTVIDSSCNSFSHLEKNHNFKQHTFVGPQWCDLCAHFMWGLVAQGVQCYDCGFQAHKKCSDKVPADCFPVMKRLKRVFGIELTSLAKMENRAVPIIFENLIREVEARDICVQGIYRISGNLDLMEEVKADLDKDIDSVDLKTDHRLADLENLTGIVKLFLRQLPIQLITSELYLKLVSILKTEADINVRQTQFRDSMSILNFVHFATLEFFIRHLNTVAKFHSSNCMTSSNLAIVFAPTIICKPNSPDTDMSPAMLISRMQSDFKWDNAIVQELIDGCYSIFSGATLNES